MANRNLVLFFDLSCLSAALTLLPLYQERSTWGGQPLVAEVNKHDVCARVRRPGSLLVGP